MVSTGSGTHNVNPSDVDLSNSSALDSGIRGSNLMSLPMEMSRGTKDHTLSQSQNPPPPSQTQLPQQPEQPQSQAISLLIEPEASLFGCQFQISILASLQLVFKDYRVTSEVRKKAEKDLGRLWRRMRNDNLKFLQANTRCKECDESPVQSGSAHKWDPKTLPLVLKLSLHFDAALTLLKQYHLDEIVAEFEDIEASYKQNHLPCPFF